MSIEHPGLTRRQNSGWLAANRYLLLRRLSQLAILMLFLAGPWFGVWLVKGNLASSLTLDTLPLTDPHVLLQSLMAGHLPEVTAIIGVVIVVAFYLLVGGRVYCSWVCPVNVVTDTAAWLRRKLGIKGGSGLSNKLRFWVLGMTLVMSALFGVIIWEFVNPVSMLHRGIIFGIGAAWVLIVGIFFYDLFVARHGWCGHLCPVGAFYSIIGRASVVKVSAPRREQCDDCMDCFAVCPEPKVITPALRGAAKGIAPLIADSQCTNCGRCIDVCDKDVFQFGTRFGAAAHNPVSLINHSNA